MIDVPLVGLDDDESSAVAEVMVEDAQAMVVAMVDDAPAMVDNALSLLVSSIGACNCEDD